MQLPGTPVVVPSPEAHARSDVQDDPARPLFVVLTQAWLWQLVPNGAPQETQARPNNPQLRLVVPCWHVLLRSQQPFGHVVELQGVHMRLLQPWLSGHARHCVPPEPQARGEVPGWHTPF